MRGELQSARQRLQRARDEQLDAVQLQAELKRARRDSIATKRRLEKLSEELQVLQTELFETKRERGAIVKQRDAALEECQAASEDGARTERRRCARVRRATTACNSV